MLLCVGQLVLAGAWEWISYYLASPVGMRVQNTKTDTPKYAKEIAGSTVCELLPRHCCRWPRASLFFPLFSSLSRTCTGAMHLPTCSHVHSSHPSSAHAQIVSRLSAIQERCNVHQLASLGKRLQSSLTRPPATALRVTRCHGLPRCVVRSLRCAWTWSPAWRRGHSRNPVAASTRRSDHRLRKQPSTFLSRTSCTPSRSSSPCCLPTPTRFGSITCFIGLRCTLFTSTTISFTT